LSYVQEEWEESRSDGEIIITITAHVGIWKTKVFAKVPINNPDRVEAVVVELTWGSRVRGNPRL
jgi:hypothetical protein